MSTGDVSATSGVDYTGFQNMQVVFNAGEGTKQVTITLQDDNVVEGDEWFELRLSNPTQGELGLTRCASVYIEDDDCKSTSKSFMLKKKSKIYNLPLQSRIFVCLHCWCI